MRFSSELRKFTTVLRRVHTSSGPVIYQSPLLMEIGVPHAFSTRIGGVSRGIFNSLNLGNPNGCAQQDSLENIAKNYELIQTAIDCQDRFRAQVHQVHGCGVIKDVTGEQFNIHDQADAIVSDDPQKIASVRTADCVPILLADRSGKRVAAIHAGWRGVAQGIVTETLKSFESSTHIFAAIGPAIGFDAFEVGPEVVDAITGRHGNHVPHRFTHDGKARIDLQCALVIELQNAGVPIQQIDRTDRCTFTHDDEFFSHRRDQGATGRMAAMIGVRDA